MKNMIPYLMKPSRVLPERFLQVSSKALPQDKMFCKQIRLIEHPDGLNTSASVLLKLLLEVALGEAAFEVALGRNLSVTHAGFYPDKNFCERVVEGLPPGIEEEVRG